MEGTFSGVLGGKSGATSPLTLFNLNEKAISA